ncbi:MAG TPA: phosphate ABC transporter substrate-binding protein PstS [Solirubrobacteraceae bacterium]|jgi:phosphate transport system substrate-binding protein|nr:phosphate ABC transporter substrate-binding protein PstS [Solirubrobacteraceae bacterium]
MKKIGALAGCAVLALGVAACGSSTSSSSSSSGGTTASGGGSSTVSGAGSTFAAPVYEQWASALSGLTVNYQAVGSGAGITALESKTVDFAATDPPLKPADESAIAKNGSPAVQIPMFLGAITVSYNLPGVPSGMKLDGKTIGDIFLGKVKTWDAAEIKALNPSFKLPGTAITVIHRSDSSGTTAGFTGFLAAVDPEWASKVGEGKTVPWPTGTGAKGNAGVAGAVSQTVGAVGYIEQAYALQHKFTYAAVKNKAGQFVAPALESTTAAAEGITVPPNLGIKIKNPSSPKAYPITSQTFIVVNKDLCKAGVPGGEAAAKGLGKFLAYGLGAGQSILSQADYSQLPPAILSKSKEAAASLQCNGSSIGG